jgi:hypothetical protein
MHLSSEGFAVESPVASQPARHDAVQSLWIGELSRLERLCMASFVRQGHPYHLYTYGELRDVPEGVSILDAETILARPEIFQNRRGAGKGSFAAFSDLFRYKLLLDLGGWWVDTDVFCLRPFEFSAPYVFGAEDKPVASGVIKVPRDSELMRQCYARARDVDSHSVLWNEYADLLADGVRRLNLMEYVLDPVVFSPVVWREIPNYVRGSRVYSRWSGSYAVHLYNEMWRRNRLDKNRPYGPTSILEILARETALTDAVGACEPKPRETIIERCLRLFGRRPAA